MNSEEAANSIVNDMKGEAFCQDPGLVLSEEEVAGCQSFTEIFTPLALPVLFSGGDDEGGVEATVDYICTDILKCAQI